MKDSNVSNINIIRGMLPKEYLKKLCSLQKPKVGIIYQYLITFIPGGNKKLWMFKQTCSCWKLCWNIYCFLLQPDTDTAG